jgi:phosphoribosylamine--glycine ligase / phosphoribosylformylglycinamidine cyclo-ligase
MTTRILVLGSGGREHALAWKLSQSLLVNHIFVCPGNGGTSCLPKTTNVDLSTTDFSQLVKFALKNEVETTSMALSGDLI